MMTVLLEYIEEYAEMGLPPIAHTVISDKLFMIISLYDFIVIDSEIKYLCISVTAF